MRDTKDTKQTNLQKNDTKPLVSVIIPTKNSGKYLAKTLESMKRQTYKNIELIVVDNYSTDNTREIARKYTDKVYKKGPERTFQVNYGAKMASGKYLYFSGGDINRDSNLIEQAVNKAEKDNCDAIYINVVTKIENANIWQKARAVERLLYVKEPKTSAARFYTKEIFEKVGGIDTDIGPIADDLTFQKKLNKFGAKTEFIDAVEYNLDEYDSILVIFKRALYYGWFIGRMAKKMPDETKEQYPLIREEYKKHKDLLLKEKSVFVAFVIYKFMQYTGGATGMLLAKLTKENPKVENFLFKINYGAKEQPKK